MRSNTVQLTLRRVGAVLVSVIVLLYAAGIYSAFSPVVLVLGIICLAFSFAPRRELVTQKGNTQSRFWLDILILLLLLLGFGFLYLYKIYTVPWQINTDEVTIMTVAQKIVEAPSVDLFGLSYYFGFPSLIFFVFGKLSFYLGGIDLFHFRVVHALFGVGSVLLFYLLCRQFFGKLKSVTFAVLLATNHALFAISRMAMRDNTGLFLELLALLCLVYGFKRRQILSTFFGGVAAGLGFYTYFPGRIIIVIWGLVLFLSLLLYWTKKHWQFIFAHGAVLALGFFSIAGPVLVATVKQSDEAFGYQKQQFLLYPEGRSLEQVWTGAPTPQEAWKVNIHNGLATFNKPLHDEGYIYPNFGNGFVDQYSGILVWIGLAICVGRIITRNQTLGDVIAAVGFVTLFLSFAFLITKAPNYTRLLVILPFSMYCSGEALWSVFGAMLSTIFRQGVRRLVFGLTSLLVTLCVGVIIYANAQMFLEFVSVAQADGNDVGSTARFVSSRQYRAGHEWVLAASKRYMYYSWGESWQWETWLGFFVGDGQRVQVDEPVAVLRRKYSRSTTILTSKAAWVAYEQEFKKHNTVFALKNVTPDGRLLAVEVEGVGR